MDKNHLRIKQSCILQHSEFSHKYGAEQEELEHHEAPIFMSKTDMLTSFVTLSALLSAALGAATPREAPRCIESLIPITASATNFDLSGGSAPPNATIPVSGTFPIQLRLCAPTTCASLHSKTLQVLIPGATFNTDYWDMSFEPETYNYVRFAAANGYWTLNMARLGAYHLQCSAVPIACA